MSEVHLFYWGAPSKGQSIRFLLEYLGLPYKETRYTPDTAMDWFGKDKQNLGFDFPNLPGIIDNSVKLCENLAITSYLPFKGNRLDLNGKGQDQFKVQEVKNVCNDVFTQAYLTSIEKDVSAKNSIWNDKIVPKLQYLEKYYQGKEWALGYITVADFYYYCAIQWVRESLDREWQGQFGSQKVFLQRFENIPKIKQYMNSSRYIKYSVQ